MMKKETAQAIAEVKEMMGNRLFKADEIQGIVSIATLKKYDLIEAACEETREEYSVADLIQFTNELLGDENSCCGEFQQIDGKIYYVEKHWGYRFK